MQREKKHAIILIIVLFFILNSCTTIATRTYDVKTALLEEQSSITIVLLSDLHNSIFGIDQSILIDKIRDANPDIIALSGDIIDNTDKITGTLLLLQGISGIAPIFFVTGNHEYRTGQIQRIQEELESYGVVILSDTYVRVETGNNTIIVAGINDPAKYRYERPPYTLNEIMETRFRELDEIPLFKVLIAHRPELIEIYKNYSFDLVLSGHTHGGQVRLPFINGLYAPNQGMFPKYAGGIYRHEKLTLVVSRGLSISYPKVPRIFNPPELVIVVIEFN